MKTFSKILIILLMIVSFDSMAQKNLTLLSSVTFPGTLAGVWHYAHNGREYALVGVNTGIAIVDVTDTMSPLILYTLPGVTSLWHEVKVWGNYAYAVSEGVDTTGVMNGLQIIDLSNLPASAPYRFWKGDSIISGLLANAHSVTADNGYVYINGHHVASLSASDGGGVIIASLSDPWNPHFVGSEQVHYCHDSYVRGDTMWTSDIRAGIFSVYNISNRANPVLLATQQTPSRFNHNAWLSDNSHYLFTTDEVGGAPIGSFDVSDLSNITLVDEYYTINMQPSEAHNVRVLNDFIINASYGSQITLIDATHPDNLIEVGNYPTGTSLCWDADPYLPSGFILATDMNAHTLYLFRPTYIRACYLNGQVTDSLTHQPIFNATVDMLTTYVHDSTDLNGNYRTGIADSGAYQMQFSKSGYYTKTVTVNLSNGVSTTLDVQLVPTSIGVNDPASSVGALVKIKNNPSENIILEISEDAFKASSVLSLIVTDELGKIVLRKSPLSERSIQFDKGAFATGSYYFSLANGDKIIAQGKLVF